MTTLFPTGMLLETLYWISCKSTCLLLQQDTSLSTTLISECPWFQTKLYTIVGNFVSHLILVVLLMTLFYHHHCICGSFDWEEISWAYHVQLLLDVYIKAPLWWTDSDFSFSYLSCTIGVSFKQFLCNLCTHLLQLLWCKMCLI